MLREQGWGNVVGDGPRAAKAQGRPLALLASQGDEFFSQPGLVVFCCTKRAIEQVSRRRGFHAPSGLGEERAPVVSLELPDVLRDGRLGDVQLLGGAREAAGAVHGEERVRAIVEHASFLTNKYL